MTNGSDEILNFAFMAFCDKNHKAVFPDITYGFYSVFAQLNNIAYEEIPLKDDFTIDINDYLGINKTIFIMFFPIAFIYFVNIKEYGTIKANINCKYSLLKYKLILSL